MSLLLPKRFRLSISNHDAVTTSIASRTFPVVIPNSRPSYPTTRPRSNRHPLKLILNRTASVRAMPAEANQTMPNAPPFHDP